MCQNMINLQDNQLACQNMYIPMKEEYHHLFGNNEDTFAIIIDATEKEPEISERKLEEKLEDYTPLGMRCKVIYLRKNSYMDTQCYLDKNSYLSVPETPTTEGFVLGGDYILG